MDTSPTPITNNYLQPDINYAAPCIFLGQPTTHSDVYSLGMLVTAVHNDGTSLMESTGLVGLIDSHTAKVFFITDTILQEVMGACLDISMVFSKILSTFLWLCG